MQMLFLFLFGGVVSFVLYLSYDRHISGKNSTTENDELKIDLNKTSELIETCKLTNEEKLEKVESDIESVDEVVKFKAKRVNKLK